VKVTLRADMGPMDAGIAKIIAGYKSLPEGKREAFKAKYDALTRAGAEWVDVETTEDAMVAVIGYDMRRLCAEFGIAV
jgi:hypothetical protein